MKIGKPVSGEEIKNNGKTRHTHIWKAVAELPNGDYLPVECETEAERNKFAAAARHRHTVRIRGNTVYVGKIVSHV